MFRMLAVFVSLVTVSTLHANVQLLSALPNAATATALQVDAAGNIYVAGTFVPESMNFFSAFVAKLSPDGSSLLYFTPLAGSHNNYAKALTLGPDGSAYVAGYTFSNDFPVTTGAFQSSFPPGGPAGFLVKVNPSGMLVYSTFIGGTASTEVTGMTLDDAGDVFLTGTGGPNVPANAESPFLGFVLELNPALNTPLVSAYGYGGGLIALDPQGNIYLAGNAQPNVSTKELALPPFPPGAFQPTTGARFCFTFEGGPGGPGGSLACQYQYVAKLNAAGALIWGSYLTGAYGATAAAMSVDSAGNVIVAGTTNSDDYPVTPGAFQAAYAAGAPAFPFPPGSFNASPPPATGYVTKMNATGTGLIWSTFLGGSYVDSITGMAIGPTGDIVLSGHADSSDFPALAGTPDACRPSANQMLGFVTRLAPDGSTAGPTQLVEGAPECLYFSCADIFYDDYPNYPASGPIALRQDGTLVFAGLNGTLASVDFSAESRLSCVVDPADSVQLSTVAPGQLLSLFGTDLASATPFVPATGVAASSNTFGVFFNGIPAPILYSDPHQINVQVPFEIAGLTTVQMKVLDQQIALPLSETLTLGVVPRQPTVFLTSAALGSLFPGYTVCGGVVAFGVAAVARNADGTLNDCTNPAIAGSTVTLFLNALDPEP